MMLQYLEQVRSFLLAWWWVVLPAYPYVVGFYRSIQNSIEAAKRAGHIQPVPPKVQVALAVLYSFAVFCFLSTFYTPSNIFWDTTTRIAAPTNVLFNRIETLRNGRLTHIEQSMRDRYLKSDKDFGLLYSAYGPNVMANCLWCNTKEPDTYLYYTIPILLGKHLIHIFLVLCATSSFFVGMNGVLWRYYSLMAATILTVGELYLVINNDWKFNTTKRTLQETDFFYWRLRLYRLLSFTTLDALLGLGLWLTSTNRWIIKPPTITSQIQGIGRAFKVSSVKLSLATRLHNAVVQDDQLFGQAVRASTEQTRALTEFEQEREVIDAKRLALSRIDVERVRLDARNWVNGVWNLARPPVQDSHAHMD